MTSDIKEMKTALLGAICLIMTGAMMGCIGDQTMCDQTCSIDAGQGRYMGGDGKWSSDPYTLKYTITSNVPINIYAVPSKTSLDLWGRGESFRFFPQGSHQQVFSVSDSITMNTHGGILIVNEDMWSDARVHVKVSYSII